MKISISIDKELVDFIKKNDPSFNLSGFCNDCLKLYIDNNKEEFELSKITKTIQKLNLQRELIIKNKLDEKYKERDLIEEQNKVWSELYSRFLYNNDYDWELMKKAIDVLGQSEDTLIGMMETLKDTSADFDKYKAYNDWMYVFDLFEDVN